MLALITAVWCRVLSDNLIVILFYEYYTTQDIVRKKYYLDRKYNTENNVMTLSILSKRKELSEWFTVIQQHWLTPVWNWNQYKPYVINMLCYTCVKRIIAIDNCRLPIQSTEKLLNYWLICLYRVTPSYALWSARRMIHALDFCARHWAVRKITKSSSTFFCY